MIDKSKAYGLSIVMVVAVVGILVMVLNSADLVTDFSGTHHTIVGEAFRSESDISEGYAPPWNIKTKEAIFFLEPKEINNAPDQFNVDITVVTEGIIYHRGYYYDAIGKQWMPFEFDGARRRTSSGKASGWVDRQAKANINPTLNQFKEGENYVIAFICTYDGGWTCGQKNLRDTRSHWTVQAITVCPEGKVAHGSECAVSKKVAEQEALYDEEGRLTDYARSLASIKPLDLSKLQKKYPEKHGKNYFTPGSHTIREGDGFGKGNFLIKFVDFNIDEQRIYFEVFKKERDGNYYHFPTYDKYIYKYEIKDLFGISFESLNDALNPRENVLIYHPSCTAFYDYCYDETNFHYAYGRAEGCNWRCPFEANSDETKAKTGMFSAVFPRGYDELASFSVRSLEQCYRYTTEFLGYDQEKPRIGIKLLLADEGGPATGKDEYVITQRTKEQLDDNTRILGVLADERATKRCPNYLALGHELTHTLTHESIGDNYGLVEGLADFVAFHNGREKTYVCMDDGWRYIHDSPSTHTNYARLSTQPSDSGASPFRHYYATGFCFWEDIVHQYGYPSFVEMMQGLHQKSRGIDDYYVLDVIEEKAGESLPSEVMERYSLTRSSTLTTTCKNCEMFS